MNHPTRLLAATAWPLPLMAQDAAPKEPAGQVAPPGTAAPSRLAAADAVPSPPATARP